MKAIKNNKVYDIAEKEKSQYAKMGFDIIDAKGKIIEHGKGKSVSVAKFEELKAEKDAIQAEFEKLKAEKDAEKDAVKDTTKKTGK